MKTVSKTEIVQTHTFYLQEKGDKKKAIEQCELLDLTIKYTTKDTVVAIQTFTMEEFIHKINKLLKS